MGKGKGEGSIAGGRREAEVVHKKKAESIDLCYDKAKKGPKKPKNALHARACRQTSEKG